MRAHYMNQLAQLQAEWLRSEELREARAVAMLEKTRFRVKAAVRIAEAAAETLICLSTGISYTHMSILVLQFNFSPTEPKCRARIANMEEQILECLQLCEVPQPLRQCRKVSV